MNAKELVLNFYKNDLLLNKSEVKEFIHPDIIIEWNSSKGFVQMKYNDVLDLCEELSRSYVRSKIKITHAISENDKVFIRYSHFVKTIENPREDMLLGHFFVIWEIKDDKLYRGFQMSQFS